VLLRNARLRELLAVCLAGGPEAEAARRLLPDLVAQVAAGLDPDQLLPRAEVVARAARRQGLSVRTHGRRLTITHGAGVVVGYAPAVEAGTALTSGAVLVR
jgi:hypothetical protein